MPLSKRKLRKLNRMSVAQLKQGVEKPEVVEMHDVTAHDPFLLVHLKVSQALSLPAVIVNILIAFICNCMAFRVFRP